MLEGQVVIITGSAGGIGRHVAKTFADERASVVVADVKPLDTVSGELAAREVDYLAVPTDVRDENAVRNLVDRTLDRFGRIDVLVNNAAIVTHFQWGLPQWPRIRDMEKDFWERVIGTNLGGTFNCTKHVLPTMEAQRSGHVVSTMGGSSSIGGCAYGVSKDAIRSFTRFVANEEREFDVCVVAVSPGAQIATEEAPEEARARMPGPDFVGNRFVLAAQVPMELSGELLNLEDGKLVPSQRR
jgi:3-oxoacyl-[acyl-carrier protein] reductase